MSYGVYGWVVWGVLVTLSAIGLAVWGWRQGQFRNIEAPKYTMLEDREPAPWPGREHVPLVPEEDDVRVPQGGGRGARDASGGAEGAKR